MEVFVETANQTETRRAAAGEGSAARPSSALIRILLVDDSPLTRKFTETVLEQLGETSFPLQVHLAECGEDALDMTLDSDYDLIVLDVEMPGLGGLKTCEMLKQRKTTARIVMLSGRTSAEAHQEGRKAGCDNYLTKPLNETDLRSILRLISLRKQAMRV